MKTTFQILRIVLLSVCFILLFSWISPAFPLMETPQDPGIIPFLKANWSQIALVISETAALFPGKVKGIVQGILSIIPLFFQKKSKD